MKKTESQCWEAWFLSRSVRLQQVSNGLWHLFEVDNCESKSDDTEQDSENQITGLIFHPCSQNPSQIHLDSKKRFQGPAPYEPVSDSTPGSSILAWAPNGLPDGPRLCLVSSRIGRQPEKHPWWLDAIRTSCAIATEENFVMVFADGMATTPFVSRITQLFGLNRIDVRVAPNNPECAWFRSQSEIQYRPGHFPVWLISQNADLAKTPLDQFVANMSDLVRALYVAPNGNIEKLIRARLINGQAGVGTWLLVGDSGTPVNLVTEIVELGAIRWFLSHDETIESRSPPGNDSSEPLVTTVNRVPKRRDLDEFLAHWTRSPNRSLDADADQARIDRLLFGLENETDGALASLLSIVVSGRLIGGSRLTRDSTPVVSFTETSLAEFRKRRVFRSHLGRWDFELYGVAIRRSSLIEAGAQQVIYGNERDWRALAVGARPWFQFVGDMNETAGTSIDWTVEREWRVCGDLDLRLFGPADLFVFAPDEAAADKIRRFSRWPAIVVP